MTKSLKVGVTGADGFLGWHVRCRLHLAGAKAVSANRETFADAATLDSFVKECDVIVHTAGVNRANSEAEISNGNAQLAGDLIAAMERVGEAVPVIYSNSTQSESGGVYGEAKQAAAAALGQFLTSSETPFVDLVLPHLFGEYGRPFYNSAVTTFAHQLAIGEEPTINGDGVLELAYAQDVAADVLAIAANPITGRMRVEGVELSVRDAWARLERLHSRYVADNTLPLLENPLDSQLFATLRSQLDTAGFYPRSLTQHGDSRGAFSELCRADGLGQTSMSTTVPGVRRGDHWHLDKFERFIVTGGSGRISLRRILTQEVRHIDVSAEDLAFVDIPPLTTHAITNTGDDIMTTVFWAADHFDPADSDTYPEPVEIS